MNDPLFHRNGFGHPGLPDFLEQHQRAMLSEVDRIPAERVLAESVDALYDELPANAMIPPLVLDEANVQKDVADVPPDRTRVTFRVPFEGDARLWDLMPSTFGASYPEGSVDQRHLVWKKEGRNLRPDDVRAEFEANMRLIRTNVARSTDDVERANEATLAAARTRIERRKEKLRQDEDLKSKL